MTALLVLRTPLQLWLAESVIAREAIIEFDLIYVTVNDAEEDRSYFARFSEFACRAQYVVVPPKRPDLIHQLVLAFRLRKAGRRGHRRWGKVVLASYDSHGINALAMRCGARELITFDDGTANIFQQSKYAPDTMSFRERIYRRGLGGRNNGSFIDSITRHYTIFDPADHLVDRERLVSLEPGLDENRDYGGDVARYFICTPFEEVLSKDQIARLEFAVAENEVDYCVRHPRQTRAFGTAAGLKSIDKNGKIAEHAIANHADGREIWLFGWFSTVLFTMRPQATRRVMFLMSDDPRTPEMGRLARNAGCEVLEI